MSRSIAGLRRTSDEQLTEEHDRIAKNTVVGVDYYLNELRRRESARREKVMVGLAIVIAAMTLVVTIATVINLWVFISS